MQLIQSSRSRNNRREIADNHWNCGLQTRDDGLYVTMVTSNDKHVFAFELTEAEALRVAKFINDHTKWIDGRRRLVHR